ncbi:DUF58 domain-containing protein [Pseudoalteromonas sp. TB64]|uniref:DUF58 domain-containing protein n=1 Tax=Pseudoalteromonas sp. TB64 TaxID=1938600 RepID=UPI0004228159|nr:DUF58 domain-containing protein [Pseudoalteromonas sp. TB64]
MIRTKLRPAKRCVKLIFCLVVFVLVGALLTLSDMLITVVLAGVAASILLDLVLTVFSRDIELTVQTSQNMALSRWQMAELFLFNNTKQTLKTDVSLHLSNFIELENPVKRVELASNEKARLSFRLRAHHRGNAALNSVELRVDSPFGFWQTSWLIEQAISLKVYPDFSAMGPHQYLNGISKKSINGLKLTKKRGSGIEFHQLREYRQGDSVRQIDWQATSKKRKLISREYQEEQNQHVVVMLDASKKMNIEAVQGNHFDHALNALLLLAHRVLKQGDWFSMQSFNQEVRWLPDVKGSQNVSRIMNHFYDLYPDQSSSDYIVAANKLITKRSKRSLVLLVTTLDEQGFDEILPAIKLLQRHHLVALINIDNRALNEVIEEPILESRDATKHCAALGMLNSHKKSMAKIRKEGVIAIDSKPEQLLPNVINTYLNVKHSGVL